jgi:hypothetical protein
MTAWILIVVLVGGGLIALAIHASLVAKRKNRAVPTQIIAAPIAGGAPIKSRAAEAMKRVALPRQAPPDLAPPSESEISAAKIAEALERRRTAHPLPPPPEEHTPDSANGAAPARKNQDSADSTAAAVGNGAEAAIDSVPAADSPLEPPSVLAPEVAPAPILKATDPAIAAATETASVPQDLSATPARAKSAASPASISSAVPASDEPELRVLEDTQRPARDPDFPLADTTLAGALPNPVPKEADEMPAAGEGIAPIVLEPQSPLASPAGGAPDAPAEESASTVAIYRPPVRAPTKSRTSATARSSPSARVKQGSLEVQLQLLVTRAGDVSAALLFERPEAFPAALELKIRNHEVHLSAYGDGWYTADAANQSSLAGTLKDGLIASERVLGNTRTSWMLSAGREIYVAAPRLGFGNYYSAPRLVLGCTQFVAVQEHLLTRAMEILAESCGKTVQRLDTESALLQGWTLLGPLVPDKPIAQRDGEDTLNLIRPMPELAILLEGGLNLRGAEWLEGFPPQISVAGPIPEGERVIIDNVAATAEGGAYKIPGYDSAGDHAIWCAGISRTYRISAAPALWDSWPAHEQRKGIVCGAISEYREKNPKLQLVTVPSSNSLLMCSHVRAKPANGRGLCLSRRSGQCRPIHSSATKIRLASCFYLRGPLKRDARAA